jgi:ubiquinol-cytochrome c reductase iron-sulfur subunit
VSAERPSEDPNGRRGLWKLLLALALALSGALRRRRRAGESDRPEGESDRPATSEPERSRAPVPSNPGAERLAAGLLLGVAIAAFGFVALFVLDPNTQLLGAALGVGLALLAGALGLAGSRLVSQEIAVEPRPQHGDPEAAAQARREIRDGAEPITRRRLLLGALGAAGAALAAAVAVPVAALGPGLTDQLSRTPWRAGRRLVDLDGKPVLAVDVNSGGLLTAFPEGADPEELGSALAVVRVDPAALRLPAGRAGWAPEGILAYSKICTHAACAISLYRSPLSPSTQSRGPALVCPCHYSTFDVLDGGSVEFGPAGRPLPQLPLTIDASGALRAAGPMAEAVGPAWWGDRR